MRAAHLDDAHGRLPLSGPPARDRGQHVVGRGPPRDPTLRLLAQRYGRDGQDAASRLAGVSATRSGWALIRAGFQAQNVGGGRCLSWPADGEPAGEILRALPRLRTVRGRMELAARRGNGAAVFVDYAHTPDAVATALAALRPHVAGRIVIVLGAGGDRDRGKRPLMCRAAATHADVVIVTDDNPRSEDPAAIRAAILEGAPEALEVGDRAEAILRGVDALEAGDALLVAGKGHETGQTVGDDVLPFDDAEQASVAVAALEGLA